MNPPIPARPRLWIGDLHGTPGFAAYAAAIRSPWPTVQIGDFGHGFGSPPAREPKDRFIRGNHDDPERCRADPHWIPDGRIEGDTLFVGGAASEDRVARFAGKDWWPDEELSLPHWDEILSAHARHRSRVVASHDAPESVCREIFIDRPVQTTRTRQALQALLEIHAPDVWIFGHWHRSIDQMIGGTRFIGLGVCEVRRLEV